MSQIIRRGSRGDPLAEFRAMKDDALVANQAMKMPGYSHLQSLYNQGMDTPDYMAMYGGMLNPFNFLNQAGFGGSGSGGAGGFSPIGANQLVDFGEGAYELFDQFRPGMEYIAENQGVGEQELANRLGTSSAGFAQTVADQEAQAQRAMGRMGIDPTSGAWQAGAGQRAMDAAAGLSGLQQQVRQDARAEDWQQRMEAAGIGLQTGQMGTDALSTASGLYNQALGNLTNMYGAYSSGLGNLIGLNEQARQYDTGYRGGLAEAMTSAVPSYRGVMTEASQMNPWLRGG